MHHNRTAGAVRAPRAVELLELLAFGPVTASQAADALGTHPRSARRHLHVLAASGWAARDTGPAGTYEAALRPLAVLWQHLRHHPLLRAAAPVIAELEREGLIAELAVPSYDVVLALRPTRSGGWHARALPPHATAAGKLLLAHRDDWRRERLAAPLHRYTDDTITDPGRLEAELATIRARGRAVEQEEHVTGWHAAATPLEPGAGPSQVAAISVGGRGRAGAAS